MVEVRMVREHCPFFVHTGIFDRNSLFNPFLYMGNLKLGEKLQQLHYGSGTSFLYRSCKLLVIEQGLLLRSSEW